jgi:hypothetical protein
VRGPSNHAAAQERPRVPHIERAANDRTESGRSNAHRQEVPETAFVKAVHDVIARYGGIASMAELRAAHYAPDFVLLLAEHGHIIRVRKGWYANTDVEPAAIRAWRVGGPLACVSALAFHGVADFDPDRLHVMIRAGSSRLRTPTSHRKRLTAHPDPAVVVHWSRGRITGDRLAVTMEEAFEQARVCRPRHDQFDGDHLEHLFHAVGLA